MIRRVDTTASLLVVLALGAVLALAGWGVSAPVAQAAGTDVTYSPSDAAVANAGALEDATAALESQTCPKPNAARGAKGRAAAIAAGWKAATAITGGGAPGRSLAAARRTKGKAALARIPATVVAGVAGGSPRAALAASLRGAELEPGNQRHYVNAAVLLMGYGRLREADGLLGVAAKLKSPAGAPFDLRASAVLKAAQGELALATGRFAAAESAYRAAAKAAPLMAEARLGVAFALRCRGKLTPAVRWKLRGDRRTDATKPGDPADPEPEVLVEPLGDADLVHGRDLASFGTFKRPANAAEGAAARDEYREAYEGPAARARFNQLLAEENALPFSSSRAVRRWIGFVSERLDRDPKLQEFRARGTALSAEWNERTGKIENAPQCYITDQHDQLFDFHRRHLEWAEAYARYHHRLLTSLAAQVGDPVYAKRLNINADQLSDTLYTGVLQLVYYTVRSEKSEGADRPPEQDFPSPCYRGAPGGAGSGENRRDDSSPSTDPCSAVKAVRTKIKLGSSVSAEFGCEGGKVEVVPVKWGIDQAYVGMFGEAGVKWKNGDVTAVTGVKASVGTGGLPGLPEVGVSGKVGAYVTAGKGKGLPEFGGGSKDTYTVKDYGIRIQSTAEIPLGKAGAFTTITKFDDKVDISMVGVWFAQE
jgi:hypothetical protein